MSLQHPSGHFITSSIKLSEILITISGFIAFSGRYYIIGCYMASFIKVRRWCSFTNLDDFLYAGGADHVGVRVEADLVHDGAVTLQDHECPVHHTASWKDEHVAGLFNVKLRHQHKHMTSLQQTQQRLFDLLLSIPRVWNMAVMLCS